ncbi:snRNA-activating protein complex subunit 3 [Nilaparvata lugens]|uniref:snRNA-activating protein complex subunit 3 n=1 Tax=Nilaparvata lugens TaxID=108931 RepID=UPI00193EA9FD|nr:snRNA-activating protein complex subunit 3 [Nilaparvata lugens]
MQEVYKKMKKFEIPSKPKVNLGEFAERLKDLLKNRVLTERPDNETFDSEASVPDFNLSLLEFPDEIPAFNIFGPRDMSTLPSTETLKEASAELKCVRLFMEELEERMKAKAEAGRKTTGKKKTTKKTPETKTTSEASGTSEAIPDETGAEKTENSGPDLLLKRPPHIRAYQIHPRPEYDAEESDLVSGEEFTVTCKVFQPFHYRRNPFRSNRRPPFQSELEILGSNTLLDLRNAIYCAEDYLSTDGDVSENPKAEPSRETLKDLYPSSMFFINETFYVDFSQPCDYSTVVKEWALSRNIKVNPDTKDMAATRISDLTVELDYPYLFQHLGNCEHLIEFSGGRILLAKRDSLCSAHYPWSRKDYITKGKYCIICTIHIPTRKVIGCARLPRHNSYLCEECFQRYCYIRNKKVGSFEAYHFKDKRATISGY